MEVARFLSQQGHEAWTAADANLETASDAELIYYAAGKEAVLVTTNKDCARTARRLVAGPVIHLAVIEPAATEAMKRSLEWLESNRLPAGRVLRVPREAPIKLVAPLKD